MIEIRKEQKLEVDCLLSFRGKIKHCELEKIGKDMETTANMAGAKKVSNHIIATYAVEGDYVDIELLLPINKKINNIGEYCFKEKIKIVNALMLVYKGDPVGLQAACNEFNQYMLQNSLQPITVGYNVTIKSDSLNIENTETNIYVGISPNIL